MKKILSFVISAAALLSLSSCGGNNTTENTTAQTSSSNMELSPPVVLDNNGDIDMTTALAYKTDIDAFLSSMEAKEINPKDTVSDNTNAETQALFDYFLSVYGKQTLSGQQMFASQQQEDLLYYDYTGTLPAIKGFDLIFTTGENRSTQQVDMAIDWHTKSNGIVAMCWHWNVPKDIDNPDGGYAFYTEEISNFSLQNAVTEGTKEYEQIIHDIDLVAIQLKRLESAGVPVLWRPLHEASGAWFWWGQVSVESAKQQNYQKLWYILYDRLENYHKLTNLIWVWNGQSPRTTVNANTYDIASIDIYPEKVDHSAQSASYKKVEKWCEGNGKMIALSECGYIPDINDMMTEKAMWLYYMPWYGNFVFKGTSTNAFVNIDSIPYINDEKMTEEFLKETMASENVITWDELPKFDGTENNQPQHIVTAYFNFKDLSNTTKKEN